MDKLNLISEFLNRDHSIQLLKRAKNIVETKTSLFQSEEVTDFDMVIHVPGEKNKSFNKVIFTFTSSDVHTHCSTCGKSYNDNTCIHLLSAAIFVKDTLTDEDGLEEEAVVPLITDNGYFSFTMSYIDFYTISLHNGGSRVRWETQSLKKVLPLDLSTAHQKFQYLVKQKIFEIDIIYDGQTEFKTNCTCSQNTYPLCEHITACFAYLENNKGRSYFNKWKDYTDEKNTILKRYGLTVNDPEAKDFNFEIDTWYGGIVLRNTPDFIIPAGSTNIYQDFKKSIMGVNQSHYTVIRPKLPESEIIDYEIGFIFNLTVKKFLGFELEPVFVRSKKGNKDIKRLNIQKESNWAFLQSLPDDMYNMVMEFNDKNILGWLADNGGANLLHYSNPWNQVDKTNIYKIRKHYYDLLKTIWPSLCTWPDVYKLLSGTFTKHNVAPAKLGEAYVSLNFEVLADSRFITIKCTPQLPDSLVKQTELKILGGMLFDIDNVFYLPSSADCLVLLDKFKTGYLKFPFSELKEVVKNILTPLQSKYSVNMEALSNIEYIKASPQPRVMLSELNNLHLMLRPQFAYDNVIVNYDDDYEYIEEDGDKIKIITRNKPEEKTVYEYLRSLHPKFSTQRNNLYYYLSFNEVMVKNWFIHVVQQIQDAGIAVYGLQELKRFKYNTSKPKFEMTAGSGVDWFDLQISVSWGEHHVSLKELRKAVLNKQEAVLLGDGTLGLIPKEWLKQYAPLMKMATENNGTLRLSKLHYALLEDIDDKLDSEEIKKEIAEKKKKLLHYDNIKTIEPSALIKATLRPYQRSGFNWLQSLDVLGWGGCLADDMGLGKTLQTITFLQYLTDKNPLSTHLVICPTSLIFNWEAELQKFCPSIKYHTYYGTQRTFDDEHFEKFNLVLTTYGMVRSDFEELQKFAWHYVILDESQAIKNPEALVTKAVQQLKAKNRLILSGTPVQNNTYDLYSQFTFLNPGFLGNREFFKNEFAHPIDKLGDKEKATQLRRMIYPFMLRRTKEQVAKDLPDKTEMILWCTMDKAQRHVYDKYKEYYRDMLMQKIDEEGLAKAGIYILEGLLRLRQICDHPALLKDKQITTTEAVKINELMREIRENTGEHKLLVFSQFTEMLSLIRDELVKENMQHCYLDGSTPAIKRKEEVNKFQDDASIKVFLISLKAGGVGLNLTAADYVYLVDPWWNPAAEQQAIDRTHRIGQIKKVFAYKMICKETVEEKILQLQEKKKVLANDLVSEEAGYVKKLSRDDIEYLFS